MAEGEEDFSSLPLTDRFMHKNWKARKSGYEDAAQQFSKTPDETDPVFRPFLQDPGLWKGAVADSNVAAQAEALNALCAFLKYGGVDACTRTRGHTVSSITEKGLVSSRPAAKQHALESLMLYIELDKAAPIIEDMLPLTSHKIPKTCAAVFNALTAIYHAYGCKVVDPKPVLKALPKAYDHRDKNVRAEAQRLTVELYRWLRDGMKPLFWDDLKPVQQHDLEKLFEAVKSEPSPKQERLLRSQQEAEAAGDGGGEEEGGDGEGGEEEDGGFDAFDALDPVDVYSKIPSDFHEKMASSKWKERKEGVEGLFAAVNVPKIKEGPFDDVIRVLAKCIQKDANVQVVTEAANSVDCLAKGLRSSFNKYRSTIMPAILDRCKERKQTVIDALAKALDSVFGTSNLTECLPEIFQYLTHKNPQIKTETLKFLIRCLRTTRDVPSKAEQKQIADAATKLLSESNEVTRNGGAEALGTLMKIIGERAMNPYLDGLDDIRKNKIKEFFETAEVKAKEKPKPKPKPAPAKAAPQKRPLGRKGPSGLKRPGASAAAAASPTADETPASPPPASKRPGAGRIPSKLGGSRGGLAAGRGGLKLQKRLGVPGSGSSGGPTSPRRVVSPQTELEEEEPASPPPQPRPRLGLGGRGGGLTGRSLGRAPSAESAPPALAPVTPTFNAVDRAELEELRAEKEQFIKYNEELRNEKSKLVSQVHELQNQNAQLIEDHTRDVLSIKAKETQLVRARSDAESAEQTVQRLQRENERLKRELARTVRATSPPIPSYGEVGEQIYRDPLRSSFGGSRYDQFRGNGDPFMSRGRPYILSPSEEKENGSLRGSRQGSLSNGSKVGSPPPVQRASSGSASPGKDSGPRNSGESWKRTAEVTRQLKARIEEMKARQGLSRH